MKQKSEIRNPKSEIVLFAVTGMSPAILTETVWALAHETPATIPDRVVVVTTRAGRDAIQRELFAVETDRRAVRTGHPSAAARPAVAPHQASAWDQLRAALAAKRFAVTGKLRFGTTADDIRVFTRPNARGRSVELDDIRTPADNEAAADFLLDALRPFAENPDVRLVCSLAGGRKTMGALLYACLSLIGRETDRLTHVLVNEPFDDPRRQPKFYFPTPRDRAAKIQLADVPFVPLRQLFPRELGRLPGRFTHLVQQYRQTVYQLTAPPRVELADDERVARVDGVPVRLPATAYALLSFLVDRARRRQPAFASYKDAVDPFKAFLADWARDRMDYRCDAHEKLKGATDDTLRKLGNTIGEALRQAGIPPAAAAHLRPTRGHFAIRIR
jgi:CRISPR-associated protein (TIGR02584 family)